MMHSKASAALMRLREIDRKYKAKPDKGTPLRSNVSTESSLESPRSTLRKPLEPNSKVAPSRPNLEVRIPLSRMDYNSSTRTEESSNETSSVESTKNTSKKNDIFLNEKTLTKANEGPQDGRRIARGATINDDVSADKWEDSRAFESNDDDTAIDEVISAVDGGSDVITETSRAAAEAETPRDRAPTNLASQSRDSEVPVAAPEMYENDTFEDSSNSTSTSRSASRENLSDVKTVSMSSKSEELVDGARSAVIQIKITPRGRQESPRRKADEDRDKRVIELVAPKVMEESSECEISLDEELSNYVKTVESTDRDSDDLPPICLLKPAGNSEALKRRKKTPKKSPRENKKIADIGKLRLETPLQNNDIGNASNITKEILEVFTPRRKSLVVNLNGNPYATRSINEKSEAVTSEVHSPMGSAKSNSYQPGKNLEGFKMESRRPIKNIPGDSYVTNLSAETSERRNTITKLSMENVNRAIKMDKREKVNAIQRVSRSPREYLEDFNSPGKSSGETARGNKPAVRSSSVSNREESADNESFSRIAETVSRTKSPGLASVSYVEEEKVSDEMGELSSTNTAAKLSASSGGKIEDSVAGDEGKSGTSDVNDRRKSADSKNISSEIPALISNEFEERGVTSVLRKLNRDAIDAMARRQTMSADEATKRKLDKPRRCRNCGMVDSSAISKISKENDNENGETIFHGKYDCKSKRKKSRTNLKSNKPKNNRKMGNDDKKEELTMDLDSKQTHHPREHIVTLRLQQERDDINRDIYEFKKSRLGMGSKFFEELSAAGKKCSTIKPLEFPKIAEYERPEVAEFDSRDQFSECRERISAIRQWLKDQYILYRDYSSLAQTLNANYVPASLEDAKKTIRELRKGTIKSR